MKALKFMLIAALVLTSAIFSACSKSADDHYKKIQELASKETLSPDDVDEAVNVIVLFMANIGDEGMVVVENAKDSNDFIEWFNGVYEKYPDMFKLANMVDQADLTDSQQEKLKKAGKEFSEKIQKAAKDKDFNGKLVFSY